MTSSAEDLLVEELVTVAIAFEGLRRTVRLDLEQRAGQQALGDVELSVLAHLWRTPGHDPATMARDLDLPQPAVRRALASLQSQELVRPDGSSYEPTDTSEGLRLMARERLAHHLRYALVSLSPAHRDTLTAAGPALERLATALGT